MRKKFKFYFSRIIAFISPALWRKIYSRPSHWDNFLAQRRLFRYVHDGVSVRLRRPASLVATLDEIKRANELQQFAESIYEPYPRPMAEDENF